MIAIGSYFVFIMFVMGTICKEPKFSKDTQKMFFYYILKEHNKYRLIHGASELFLNKLFSLSTKNVVVNYGLLNEKVQGFNYYEKSNFVSSKLSDALATEIVAYWYNTGKDYNYEAEPSSDTADPFTQIVWKETKKIEIAIFWYKNVLYVAVYYMNVGNTKGDNHYINNVKKPQILST